MVKENNKQTNQKDNASNGGNGSTTILKIIVALVVVILAGNSIHLYNVIDEKEQLIDEQLEVLYEQKDLLEQCAENVEFGIGLNERYAYLLDDIAKSFDANTDCAKIIYPYIEDSIAELVDYTNKIDEI